MGLLLARDFHPPVEYKIIVVFRSCLYTGSYPYAVATHPSSYLIKVHLRILKTLSACVTRHKCY